MEGRKIKGILWFVNGLLLIAGGAFLFAVGDLPAFFAVLVTIAGIIGNVLGFKFVFPDK